MNVSRNWIQQYLNFDLPATVDLTAAIGAQLGAVEAVSETGARYAGAVIVNVVQCNKHENSDHLNVCLIDDGGVIADVERNADGHVQVVCGAPNVRAGLSVVWLPPGATVPESFDKDPFVLGSRALRGVTSHGMLASPRELALGDSHDGILEIHQEIAPGTAFVDAFGLNDTIIDVENKMFTHRPDCFGQLGVAREVAGILNKPFSSPEWYKAPAQLTTGEGLELAVNNDLTDEVPRFMAQAVKEIVVRPSPVWLQTLLSRVGIRPINNVVDVTNYMMMLTGQPLHAYDYDKVKALTKSEGASLTVRRPAKNETITLLNGKTITPRPEAIMIASGDHLIGIGGVMGGADTEVDDQTANIILECATFDMYSVRRTSMAHGLFTDAVTRNNKGQSPLQNDRIMAEAVRLLGEVSGASPAGEVFDLHTELPEAPGLQVSVEFINSRLGLTLTARQMIGLLANVEFEVYDMENTGQIFVKAPFWRTDIAIDEDIVEEVGRLYGFDKLPLVLPSKPVAPTLRDPLLALSNRLRNTLSRAGANEILTYSFVPGSLLEKAGQTSGQAFKISNAISPDLQYYRLSMAPSLLDKVRPNLKTGYDRFALYEFGKVHNLMHANDDSDGLPQEFDIAGLVWTTQDKQPAAGAAFYQVRRYLDQLAAAENLELVYKPIAELPDLPIVKPYQADRSAYVHIAGSDEFLGIIGEFTASTRAQFKLPLQTAGFEIDLVVLHKVYRPQSRYVPASRFPKIEQDLCLKVPAATTYRQVTDLIQGQIDAQDQMRITVEPLDIYQRQDDELHKQITVRLTAVSYAKTLTDAEVSRFLNEITKTATDQLKAERI